MEQTPLLSMEPGNTSEALDTVCTCFLGLMGEKWTGSEIQYENCKIKANNFN